jgi:hypothetical protein
VGTTKPFFLQWVPGLLPGCRATGE